MSRTKDGSYIQDRHDKLVYRLVELIATHPGIWHNELKRVVKDKEHITTTNTYDKTIKELLKDEIIERKRGKQNRIHYYIYDKVEHKIIKYDKKFDKEMSELKKLIDKIEMDFPDYNDYTAHFAFFSLDHIKAQCKYVIEAHKSQDDVNLLWEDSILDNIRHRMKQESDEKIQEYWKEAQVTYTEIEKSRKETSNIITKLLKVKSSRKELIKKLIENTKMWKQKREELLRLGEVILSRVSYLETPYERRLFVEPK